MTNQEQNIAIAEACGRKVGTDSHYCPICRECVETEVFGDELLCYRCTALVHRGVPSYTTDLNAMHEAEKILNNSQYHSFTLFLSGTSWKFYPDPIDDVDYKQRLRNTFSATAAQRAEAFLRVLNLWKETEIKEKK